MEQKRRNELLAYAQVCFEHCISPFVTIHLKKKKVTSSECIELSKDIAKIIEEDLEEVFEAAWEDGDDIEKLAKYMKQAKKEFKETQ